MQHSAAFRSFRPPAWGRTDLYNLADFPLAEQISVVVAQQVWSSVPNIALRLDKLDSEIYGACHDLEKANLISGRDMGVTRRSQRRYVLTRRGVMHVTQDFHDEGKVRPALPLTWQMTEDAVTRMLQWLPMIETFYEILPTFWTSGLAAPYRWQSMYSDPACSDYIWLGKPTLVDVSWFPSGRLHAGATWSFERDGELHLYSSVPFLWLGLLPQEGYRSRSLRLGSQYMRSARTPGARIWWDIKPSVVAFGLDQFAAFRAGTAYGDDVQVGSVDPAGALVWSAEASHSQWTLRDTPPQARSIGHPEAAAIGEGPDMVGLGGIREYRVLCFLSDFRAAQRADLVRAFHMSRGAVKTVLDRLEDRGLVTSVEGHAYVTNRGLDLLAARDRIGVGRLVEVTHLDPHGEDAVRERRHDAAVARTAATLLGAGIPVAAGWRYVVSWHDGQLVPDLWVRLPVPGQEEGIWVAVEVEFSARAKTRIQKKIRSYRLAPLRLRGSFPMLVIAGEASAAKGFDDLAGDLPMLSTTWKNFFTGVWEGPESVWRRQGKPVGFSDFAREQQAHLWQPTGRSLDYSTPSPEVWDRLLRAESRWSDPQHEGLVRICAPIPPTPRAETDLEVTAPKEEPSAEKQPAAPTPPASASVPIKAAPTDEDQARHRSHPLNGLHILVGIADESAKKRLTGGDLREVESLCLERVRAIITYGANMHYQAEKRQMEQSLRLCIRLRTEHLSTLRSGNRFWWLTESETTQDPRQAYRDLLKHFGDVRHDKKGALKMFDDWFRVVDRAARADR